jgi:aspartate dehydrogenase
MNPENAVSKKIGIAGTGALGRIVIGALHAGIPGCSLTAISDLAPPPGLSVPNVDFKTLARDCDLIIECLPAAIVPDLTQEVFNEGKDIVIISSAALLIHKVILEHHKRSQSRIIVPSGAIIGLDGVQALAQSGIKRSRIASIKHPRGFVGAPFIKEKNIALDKITKKECLFKGNALEAANAFPANVNVAATLSLAGIGPLQTEVEIWADPEATGNTHDITVEGEFSTLRTSVENTPDPANPKSSMLAGHSIVSVLRGLHAPLVVL